MLHDMLTYASIALFLASVAMLSVPTLTSFREVRAIDKRSEREALEKRLREAAFRDYWRE